MYACCLYCRYGIRCNVVLPGFIQTNMTFNVPENIKDQVNFEPSVGWWVVVYVSNCVV